MFFSGYIWLYEFTKAMTLLCYYQEDVGLSAELYQLTCMKIYCYVELYRPMCGYIKQFRAVGPWHV